MNATRSLSLSFFLGWALSCVLWSGGLSGVAHAAPNDEAVRLVARHGTAATVGIYCQKAGYSSYFGTGVVITADGYILTSTTVVPNGAEEIEVIFADFVSRKATIVETNDSLETTLIKVEGEKLTSVSLARELPAVGTSAFTFSNANNVLRINGSASFSHGSVSGVYDVANLGGESLYSGVAIETTAAVNPGSDGGPILNSAGQLCAIISLNVSPLRWQGVGVPTKVLLERLDSFKSGRVTPQFEPLAGLPPEAAQPDAVARRSEDAAKFLVGVNVRRKFAPEQLPRMPWEQYQPKINDWDKLSTEDKTKRVGQYFDMMRLVEVNQMLRRPAGALTGVVISADGFILTSQFNVGDDVAFLAKASGGIRKFDILEPIEKLIGAPDGGYSRELNPVEQVTVTLPDGSQKEAQVVARHLPLGVALLKVDASSLPYLDVDNLVLAPEVGHSVALLGIAAGAATRHTFNPGIVSAAQRNRGFQFQTDALVNYGNSGGPVIDGEGRLLGFAAAPIDPVTVMGRIYNTQELNGWQMAPNSGVALVARADRIREALADLKAGKSILQLPGPYLGIAPDQAKLFGEEVFIGLVTPKSPADNAGLRAGDRLISINGEELRNWRDLLAHLGNLKPGDKVELKVFRPRIVQKLMVKDKEVATPDDLKKLRDSLKPGEKFEGVLVAEDTQVISVTLGERP